MTAFFIYLLQVIVCSALFAGCYWLFLRNERFYHWNRFYIVASVMLSISIPLLNIPISTSQIAMPTVTDYIATMAVEPIDAAVVAAQPETAPFPWAWLGLMCCMFVIFFLLAKEVVSFIRILRLKRRSERISIPEAVLYYTDDATAPFTFFRTIFWKKDISVDSGEGRYVLRHELAHVRLGHSWDKALMQLVCCVFWMNPFFMLFRRELELVHEFAADSEGNAEELSSLILCTLYPNHYYNFTNRFFQSSIKRRITMINKDKKSKLNLLRKMSIIPVALIALYFFACSKVLTQAEEQMLSFNENPFSDTKSGEEIFAVVEEMPKFPGGEAELLKYIIENVQYPKNAMENNIQGRVFVQFVVTSQGTIGETKVLRGVDPELDAEAIRVINSLPTFSPGKQGGVPVAVWYQVPITFQLRQTAEQTLAITVPATRSNDDTFVVVEEMPKFPGGETELMKFLHENVVYPESAKANNIQGRVFLQFVVTAEGTIGEIRVLRGVDPLLDQAAVEAVKKLPAFTPGKQGGVPVAVWYNTPITFRLSD